MQNTIMEVGIILNIKFIMVSQTKRKYPAGQLMNVAKQDRKRAINYTHMEYTEYS